MDEDIDRVLLFEMRDKKRSRACFLVSIFSRRARQCKMKITSFPQFREEAKNLRQSTNRLSPCIIEMHNYIEFYISVSKIEVLIAASLFLL